MTEPVCAEPVDDATEDCAEFEVGPAIGVGDLRCARDAARAPTERCSRIGAEALNRT